MNKILILTLAIISISGCSHVTLNSANVTDLENVDFSKSFKSGQACEIRVLLFGPFGAASIMDAAKSAEIKKVEVVESKNTDYIFFAKRCTIVHGE